MTDRDDLVARVLTQARIAGAARRRAVERELRDHIDDAAAELRAAGCADEQLADRIAERFGDPGEIAHAFDETYRAERVMANALLWSGQLVVSFLAAAAVIATVQLLSAVLRRVGLAPVFAQFKMETIGFAALASGYVASCWVEHMLQRKPVFLRAGAYLFVAATLAVGLTLATPGHPIIPSIACACGGTVRLLEHAGLRWAALVGSAALMLPAWIGFGPLIPAPAHIPRALLPFLVTLNVALACRAMSWFALEIDRRYRIERTS